MDARVIPKARKATGEIPQLKKARTNKIEMPKPKAGVRITAVPVYGDDWLAKARYMLGLWRDQRDNVRLSNRRRKSSLEHLAKALDRLDPADRPKAFKSVRADVAARLTKRRRGGRKLVNFNYDLAIVFLMRHWKLEHGRSPLTHWKQFQEFAGTVTRGYNAPAPGQRCVRRWAKGSRGRCT
jgi:hypothetical protein